MGQKTYNLAHLRVGQALPRNVAGDMAAQVTDMQDREGEGVQQRLGQIDPHVWMGQDHRSLDPQPRATA